MSRQFRSVCRRESAIAQRVNVHEERRGPHTNRLRRRVRESSSVSANVVNLNRFRKKKQREEKAKQAEINRLRHGRTQAEKDRERAERERANRLIEGKRLERQADEPGAAGGPAEDSDETRR